VKGRGRERRDRPLGQEHLQQRGGDEDERITFDDWSGRQNKGSAAHARDEQAAPPRGSNARGAAAAGRDEALREAGPPPSKMEADGVHAECELVRQKGAGDSSAASAKAKAGKKKKAGGSKVSLFKCG